jgi:predicted small lipoprotein YifL
MNTLAPFSLIAVALSVAALAGCAVEGPSVAPPMHAGQAVTDHGGPSASNPADERKVAPTRIAELRLGSDNWRTSYPTERHVSTMGQHADAHRSSGFAGRR